MRVNLALNFSPEIFAIFEIVLQILDSLLEATIGRCKVGQSFLGSLIRVYAMLVVVTTARST
jgi:hypothetical protein